MDAAARHSVGRRLVAVALLFVAAALLVGAAATALAARHTPTDTRAQRALPPPPPQPLFVSPLERLRAGLSKPLARRHKAAPRRRPAPTQQPIPVRITIPAIRISAPVIPLRLNADRTLQVPSRADEVGWFVEGPEPGELGAAVIAGHVDSRDGPGVFYHLRALSRGDRLAVVLATGRRLPFVVTGTKQVSKGRFPVKQVYRRTPHPTLRLITCDGRFDRSTRHYVDNFIVFARLDVSRPRDRGSISSRPLAPPTVGES